MGVMSEPVQVELLEPTDAEFDLLFAAFGKIVYESVPACEDLTAVEWRARGHDD